MMRIVSIAAVVLATLALAERPVAAQGLADAAAKEKERRRASQAKAKVYTESDLGRGGSASSVPDSDAAAPAPGAAAKDAPAKDAATPTGQSAKKEKTPDELRAEQEKAWREKLQQANDNVGKLGARVEALQRAVNDISSLYGSSRTAQLNELEQTQKQLADAKQALADLEDEGRRSGYR
jgi:DNA repair exonuclease SbcCD ATPase subunit